MNIPFLRNDAVKDFSNTLNPLRVMSCGQTSRKRNDSEESSKYFTAHFPTAGIIYFRCWRNIIAGRRWRSVVSLSAHPDAPAAKNNLDDPTKQTRRHANSTKPKLQAIYLRFQTLTSLLIPYQIIVIYKMTRELLLYTADAFQSIVLLVVFIFY